MSWCLEDEADPRTDEVLDRLAGDEAHTPALWTYEVANVLLIAERRGRLTESQVICFIGLLEQLPILVDTAISMNTLLASAKTHQLTAYDAAYLVLAERLGVPLATLDADLAAAAIASGVPLLLRN